MEGVSEVRGLFQADSIMVTGMYLCVCDLVI